MKKSIERSGDYVPWSCKGLYVSVNASIPICIQSFSAHIIDVLTPFNEKNTSNPWRKKKAFGRIAIRIPFACFFFSSSI